MIVSYSNAVDAPRGSERIAWGEAKALSGSTNLAFVSSSNPAAANFPQITIGAWTRRWYRPFGRSNPFQLGLFHLLSLFNPFVFVRSFRLFRRVQPKVVHTHNIVALSPSVWLAARLAGSRVVHTHHDVWLVCERATLTDSEGNPCHERTPTCLLCRSLRPIKRAQLALVSTEVFPSEWVRDRLGRQGDVVPSFATGSFADPLPAPVLDGPIVFVGSLTAHKGVRVLLEAFEASCPFLPRSTTLVICGSGPLEDEVAASAERNPAVRFEGEVDPTERDRLLRSASLLVIPSTCAENSPLVFFEALAAGLPVVVSNVGGMPELRRYGNVVVVTPGSADELGATLIDLFASTPRLHELGQNARRNRDDASPERFAQQVTAVIDRSYPGGFPPTR